MTVSLRSNQALQASTLVGRAIFVPASDLVFNNNDVIKIALFFSEEIADVIIYLENDMGDIVLKKKIGNLLEGDLQFEFDPLDGGEVNLGNGRYYIRAEGMIKNQLQLIPTYVKAIVESVNLADKSHEPMLNLKNKQTVALSKVRIIL